MKHPTKESFLRDVADHELRIFHDDGAYRHIQGRKKNGSNSYYFNIVTWPGSLAFNGDMGTFVFERNSDMFAFFRRDELAINECYWLQKCTGVCRTDGLFEFDVDLVSEYCHDAIDSIEECSEEEKKELKEQLAEEVLNCDDKSRVLANMLEFEYADGYNPFGESCDWPSFETPSFRAIWCLYAIVWAIARYDEAKGASLIVHAGEGAALIAEGGCTMKEEGDPCPHCATALVLPKVEGCTCFRNPPCSACVSNPLTCPKCGWDTNDAETEGATP